MDWRGMGWMAVIVLGCGPQVGTDGGDDTTTQTPATEDSAPDPSAATLTTNAEGPDPTAGTAPDPTTVTTTPTTGIDDTTTTDGEDTTTGDECGCPPNVPVGLDDVLERGFTPAEALAEIDELAIEMWWFAYAGDPMTIAHVDVAYVGGAITQGPGGTDGCGFLSAPCDDGVLMDVELTLWTEDGWMSWTTAAQLHGIVGEELWVQTDPQPIADNAGSLAMQPLVLRGEVPQTLEDVTMYVGKGWTFRSHAAILLEGHTAEGPGYIVLGQGP